MKQPIKIINTRGEEESFSFRKIQKGAKRAGASGELALEIAEIIRNEAYEGITTKEIFNRIKTLLQGKAPQVALRFSIKEAMRRLGPAGFAFEKFVGEIFLKQGFKIKFNQDILGRCSIYEIDFLARKGHIAILGECKYRSRPGDKIDLPFALQNYARFLDIKEAGVFDKETKLETVLVTNTKFSSQTIKYSECVGAGLLGWRYPKKEGLEYFIDRQKLYPITILPSFKRELIDVFVKENMMLAEDVLGLDTEKLARENKLPISLLNRLTKEAQTLFGPSK